MIQLHVLYSFVMSEWNKHYRVDRKLHSCLTDRSYKDNKVLFSIIVIGTQSFSIKGGH